MWDDEIKGAAYVITAIFSFWLTIIFLTWKPDSLFDAIISYHEGLAIVSFLLLIISLGGALYYDR